jgi:glycosyltransferase involved in cell wall biosynthesis
VDKNVFGTIAAFFSLCEKYDDIKLVLIGKPVEKFFDELFKKFDSNHFIKRIDFFTNVNSSDELREFYSNSVALVFPSFHEGFGIPIIEAQACGCPVITSNTTACPEVAGDGAVLVAPYSVDAIADGMERILNDSQLRQDLIRKGYENIKRFSWDKVAAMTEEVYKLECEVSQ